MTSVRPFARLALIFAAVIMLGSPARALAATVDNARIRVTAPYLQDLIAEGMANSSTFRRLVERLRQSDIVVYVMPGESFGVRQRGQLTFLTTAAGTRYVKIEIGWELNDRQAVAILGHELQHAVELADAPEVRDSASLARFYHRIGHASMATSFGEEGYDTREAVLAGDRVWRELSSQADD